MKSASYSSSHKGLASDLAKPQVVKTIIECLLPAATPIVIPESGGSINLHTFNIHGDGLAVILLLKGKINFLRTASKGILFGAAYAPAVLGLQGSHFRKDIFKYVAVEDSEIYVLSRDIAIGLINQRGLIREVLDYHAYISDMEVIYSTRLINKSSYEVVCTLLNELAEQPEAVRLKSSVSQFILERSKMGRSGMMRILADLRKGEYVDIQNGRLIKILKRFPSIY